MYNSYSTPTQDPLAHLMGKGKSKRLASLRKLFVSRNPVALVVAVVGLLSLAGVTLAAVVIPYVTRTGRYSSTPEQSSANIATACRTSFDVLETKAWGCQGITPIAQPVPSGYVASYRYQCDANQSGATYYFFAIRRSQSAGMELLSQGTTNLSPVVNIRDGEYVEVQCNPFRGNDGAPPESVAQSCTSKMQLFSDSLPTPSPVPSASPVSYQCNSECVTGTVGNTTCQASLGSNYTCYNGRCRLVGNETSATCDYRCNAGCTTNAQCQSALGSTYSCVNNLCRLTSNPTSTTCAPIPTPSPAPSSSPISYTCNSPCTTGSVGNTQCRSSMGSAYSCYNGQCRLTSNPTSTTCTAAQVCQSPIKKDTGNYCKQKADGTLQNYVSFLWYRQQNINQYEVDVERLNTTTNTYSLFINNGWRTRSAFGGDCAYTSNYSEHCDYSVYLAPGTYRARIKARSTTAPVCTETPYVYTDPITLGSCS